MAMVVIVGLVVLSSFRSTGVRSWKILLIAVGIGVAAVGPAALAQGSVIQIVVLLALAVGMALGPPNIVRRIFEHERITVQLVIAALCAYIQVAFAFAFAYGAMDGVTEAGVLSGRGGDRFFDYVYFSFVTITTVGYGDITATGDLARALAIVETLLGQIFLVVLVAYLVGTLTSGHRTRTESD